MYITNIIALHVIPHYKPNKITRYGGHSWPITDFDWERTDLMCIWMKSK